MVDEIGGGYVTAFGAGLVGGMSGQNQTFTITAKKGTLSKYNISLLIENHVKNKIKNPIVF